MRYLIAVFALLFAQGCFAARVNVPAETGSPVNEDDWSIPTHRCLRSTWFGVGVYDGAERCTMAFALPLAVGRRVTHVQALYEDDDFTSQLEMEVLVRDAAAGGNAQVVAGKDYDPSLTVLDTLKLEPDYLITKDDAVFVLVELRGDTRLLAISYEYE